MKKRLPSWKEEGYSSPEECEKAKEKPVEVIAKRSFFGKKKKGDKK